MKALLVADNEKAITNISSVLKSAGYDTIVYKWLLKALDNIEEIAPHLIIVSTGDYPRHWKTLAQYATSGFGDYTPQMILYTDENFSEEEQKKAEALHVRGTFGSVGVEGLDQLRKILSKTDDIFSGYLTEEEQKEISIDELIPHKKSEDNVTEKEIEAEENEAQKAASEESFDDLVSKFEETNCENNITDCQEETIDDIQQAEAEAIGDEMAADRLEEIAGDERAADRLEEILGDEVAADKLERMAGNEEDVITVESVMNKPYDENDAAVLPGIDELKKLLEENKFDNSENDDIIEKESDEETGENDMADEQSIDEKLAAIMNANKADQKEKAEALKLDTTPSSVSFVFTNPITLAMVSGVARNYNGLVLEFTPDIPSFIMNLSPGTKIGIASMKIDDKIENVFAEVMSNDAKKLALAIKK